MGGFIEIITTANGFTNNGLVNADGTSGMGGAAYGTGNAKDLMREYHGGNDGSYGNTIHLQVLVPPQMLQLS